MRIVWVFVKRKFSYWPVRVYFVFFVVGETVRRFGSSRYSFIDAQWPLKIDDRGSYIHVRSQQTVFGCSMNNYRADSHSIAVKEFNDHAEGNRHLAFENHLHLQFRVSGKRQFTIKIISILCLILRRHICASYLIVSMILLKILLVSLLRIFMYLWDIT